MIRLYLAASVFCLLSIGSCFAAEPDAILKDMPDAYNGIYQWDSGTSYYFTVVFSSRKAGSSQTVELDGSEFFTLKTDQSQKYESKVHAVIDARTLSFEMKEIYDTDKKDGFIPMTYSGRISPDLREINGSWTGDGGKRVTISLSATTH